MSNSGRTGLPVEGGSGGRTKMQRIQHKLPKQHYYDALCVGASTPKTFTAVSAYAAVWSAKGRGNRQRCRTDQYGFPFAISPGRSNTSGFRPGISSRPSCLAGSIPAPGSGELRQKPVDRLRSQSRRVFIPRHAIPTAESCNAGTAGCIRKNFRTQKGGRRLPPPLGYYVRPERRSLRRQIRMNLAASRPLHSSSAWIRVNMF